MPEFDLIARIRERAAHAAGRAREDVILGIGDDAAVVSLPTGKRLAVAMDTLNRGVHFPPETAPADLGWKALAVNVSDLAAMGATPLWCTLSLSLPESDAAWLDGFIDGFLDGFFALAAPYRIALIGGDTTRGPLSVCVTVHGWVEARGVLRRDAAQAGDDVWATGTLGDAAGALRQWRAGGSGDARDTGVAAHARALRERLDRPTPRVAAGQALAGLAHACIDISDGLVSDLGHICKASGVAAALQLEALPASAALRASFDADTRRELQAAGGDDYELCFTAPRTARLAIEEAMLFADTPVARIGRIVDAAEQGAAKVVLRDANGDAWQPMRGGYEHFG
jgi:thiamine-monophosphate kinase